MLDFKDTAVFMYKAAILYLGWFWGSKCDENCKL